MLPPAGMVMEFTHPLSIFAPHYLMTPRHIPKYAREYYIQFSQADHFHTHIIFRIFDLPGLVV